MSDFNSQLERMKSLMTYGRVNEDTAPSSNCSLEFHKEAADGNTYGIIREFSNYYIKQAKKGKELLPESYNYIGGYMNKRDYEYDSYQKALKNFELKLASINEACEGKVNIQTLDPFKREDLVIEGTEKMKDEIARQRQIMYNAAMIMNESTDYAVKGDGCKCDTKQPEAPKGKNGAEGNKEAKVEDQDKIQGTQGLDKKVGPFTVDPSKSKNTVNEGCKCGGKGCCECGKMNEEASATDTDFDDGLRPGLTSKIGDGDPFEKHETVEDSVVNEEASATDTDFDEGLPSNGEAGVGEADTDHNNDPFNNGTKGELNEEDGEEDFVDDEVENNDEDEWWNDDLESEDGEEGDEDFSGEELDINDDEDAAGEELDANNDEDVAGEDNVEVENEVDESDPESIRAEIERLQSLLDGMESDEFDGEEEPTDDYDLELSGDEEEFPESDEFEDVDDFEGDEELGGEDVDECGNSLYEAKRRYMNSIVESVKRDILNEDELHDFGKHPGYRKKPFTLPQNGEDRNKWGRDWNDESVHGEEPFGKQIGDSAPFDKLVNAVTKDVMYQLKKGVPLDNKKKD